MKFLVYKATGGLTHMILRLCYSYHIAKKENRILIIDCKTHSAFMHNFSDFFILNTKHLYSDNYDLFPNLSESIKKSYAKQIRPSKYSLFYNNNFLRNYQSDKVKIIFGKSTFSTLLPIVKVKKDIIEKIESKFNINEKYISVHFRNTDIKNNILVCISKINYVSKKYNIKTIYLATDDYSAFEKIKKVFPKLKIIQYTKPQNFRGKNIHYNTKDKYLLIFNCLLDIYVILRSTIFIPSMNSGLSKWIISMKNNNIFDIKSDMHIIK